LSSSACRKTVPFCSWNCAGRFVEVLDAAKSSLSVALATGVRGIAARDAAAANGLHKKARAIGYINKAWRRDLIMLTASAPTFNAESSKK
jgi:hypothetical protein